jgi:FAD/FMN-containing dehydrogenase
VHLKFASGSISDRPRLTWTADLASTSAVPFPEGAEPCPQPRRDEKPNHIRSVPLMTTEGMTRTAEHLRALCGGAVHLPGDPGYDAARTPWNVAVDLRPAAVAYPTSASDVRAVVSGAVDAGLRVAPQSTGHNAGPLGRLGHLDDVVLVKTSAMRRVSVDPVARKARVESGALWLDVVEAAERHGLAALHGSSPDVGVAGYSLGGGVSWYARRHGLQTNSLTAVEIVLADGSLVRADDVNDRALFWALRGGGGNFGVVTALEFDLYPITTAYAGMLAWDRRDAEKVLRRWADWSVDAPSEVTTSFRILNLPPLPELPELVRGRQLAVIDGAVLGSDEAAADILAGLRELRPEIDTFRRSPAASLIRLHMDPEGPTPVVSDGALLSELPDAAVDAFLAEVGEGSTSSLLLAELRQLGGALGRRDYRGGAMPMIDAQFTMFAAAIAATPEHAMIGRADAIRLRSALADFSNGRSYLNLAENPINPKTGYSDESWEQLKAIRSIADPDAVFVANHRIPRLYEQGRPSE